MLNVLWSGMILSGILWAAVHGRLDQVTQGALASAKEAVSLCITMLGVMSLWTGILEIGRGAGLIERLSRTMRPVLRFLFRIFLRTVRRPDRFPLILLPIY